MNCIDAAEKILADAGEPLHYSEITRRILASDLWQTKGLTPKATVSARLGTDIKDHGTASRFQRTGKGVFALRAWGLPEYVPKVAVDAPGASEIPGISTELRPPTLSFTDAAEAVLEQYGKRRPMHYRDITNKVLELKLVNTKGQTPEATLYAQVLTETKRRTRRGEQPRFVMHGKGYIGLTRWAAHGLAFQIERHNAEVRKRFHERLQEMLPAEFEALIGQLLVALGFEEVEVTAYGGDGGIDVRGTLVVGDVIRTRMAVQVKRWKRNVQAPIVQQVRGSLGTHEQGLIITTSNFSKGARAEADRPNAVPVALMNGEELVKLLVENDIGVERETYDLIEFGTGIDQ